MVRLENHLYGGTIYESGILCDVEFLVDRIIKLPELRPFEIEKAVRLCVEHCKNSDFRQQLLEKTFFCPFLIHRLYGMGVFHFSEIFPNLSDRISFVQSFYFRKEITDFEHYIMNKIRPYDINPDVFKNDDDVDLYIKFGFLPSSIEYCLKYDDISIFRDLSINERKLCTWSPFEWSRKPQYLDLLSFSGFFGSIHCFKFLLLNGYQIDDRVKSIIVCSGSSELFHFCHQKNCMILQGLFNAARFCRKDMLSFFIDNGAYINSKDNAINIWCMNILFFIILLLMAILA